ncbi:glycosyltransferase, partial [Brucella sp. 21LCYQ03]|nr:glycosyltransferase [Brucella sp. 21LCYQ03]
MSDTPVISVIIPAFNAAAYIAQCIENVKYQTYKDIEVLVIDDGSIDETVTIAKSFNVKVISQGNNGVSAARNTGLKNAVGQYIHFLDVDDLINHCF